MSVLHASSPCCHSRTWNNSHLRRTRSRSALLFFQAEDGIRGVAVTGVQTCALPISGATRGEAGSEVPVCDRRLESLAGGDRRGVRHREPGAKVPPSQARERQRILAGGAEEIGRASCRERV